MIRTAFLAVTAAFVLLVGAAHGSNGEGFGSSAAKPEQIAFVRSTGGNSELRVINADGTGQQLLVPASTLAAQQAFSWSPDGRRIAFPSRTGTSVVSAAGTGFRALTHGLDDKPVWSPDGRTIAFARYVRRPLFHADIYLVNADGSHPRFLAHAGNPTTDGLGHTFAWSPDGRRVAYVSVDESRILLIDARGGRPRPLERRRSSITIEDVAWSPDGRRIAYADYSPAGLDDWSEICIKDIRGGRARCPNSMGGPNWSVIHEPAWSPSSRRLLYTDENRGVVLTNPDGKRQRVLPGGEASWSSDGQKIAVSSGGDMYVVNADGSGRRWLTQRGADEYPLWQPEPARKG